MYVGSRINNILTGNPINNGISVTSTDIINNYNILVTKIREPETIRALKYVEDQQDKNGEELIKYSTVCDVPMLNNIRDRIGGLEANRLKEYTIKQLHNPAAMNAAMCVADSIFYTSPSDIGSFYLNNRIRLYIHNMKQIGSDTVEGYVLTSDFENAKDFFVIKVARSPSDDTLLHELIIGLYGTNKLRQYIPNFTYVYGGFKCSPPLIDPETKKVVTWCLHDDNAVNYVIYENINHSISMNKYLETCSGKDFLNVYMQTLYAIRLAFKVIDYTHYDLNYDNVLIRNPFSEKRKFQIKYETERGVEYITTQIISTIMDYGNSHVKIKEDQHYGKNGLIQFSIYPYRSWIMHDMYKFLMFCLSAAIKNNNQSVIREAIKIFRFFNYTEDVVVAVNEQLPLFFSFPLTETTSKLSINDLASHIRSVCDCDFINIDSNSYPILDCEKICLTENEILSQIGINLNGSISIPDNIIEFYDIAVRLQNENKENEKQRIARDFSYRSSMKSHINKMEILFDELLSELRKLKIINVGQITIDQLLQYNTMMIVRSTYVSIGSIIDKTITLKFYNEIGHAVALSYGDDKAILVMDNIMTIFDKDVRPSVEDAKRTLGINHDYLNKIESDIIIQTSIQRDPRLRWYWDGRDLFDIVFGRTIWDNNTSKYTPISSTNILRNQLPTPSTSITNYTRSTPITSYTTTPTPIVNYTTTTSTPITSYTTTPTPIVNYTTTTPTPIVNYTATTPTPVTNYTTSTPTPVTNYTTTTTPTSIVNYTSTPITNYTTTQNPITTYTTALTPIVNYTTTKPTPIVNYTTTTPTPIVNYTTTIQTPITNYTTTPNPTTSYTTTTTPTSIATPNQIVDYNTITSNPIVNYTTTAPTSIVTPNPITNYTTPTRITNHSISA